MKVLLVLVVKSDKWEEEFVKMVEWPCLLPVGSKLSFDTGGESRMDYVLEGNWATVKSYRWDEPEDFFYCWCSVPIVGVGNDDLRSVAYACGWKDLHIR